MFFIFSLGLRYVASLKLMGGLCFLKFKNSKKSLQKRVTLMVDNVDHVNEVQINGVSYEHFKHVEHLDKCAFDVEWCYNMNNFLSLTKMDFEQEKTIKRHFFGKEFENMDCPDLTRTYLRAITLGQTFNDEFTFVSLPHDYIPCSAMHSEKRRSTNVTMSSCELAKMRLMMMAFIHNEVSRVSPFADIYDSDFQEHIGSRVYFHDRLIECGCVKLIWIMSPRFS